MELCEVTVSEKGQLAIPARMRRSLGIERGTRLVCIRQGERLILEKEDKVAALLERELEKAQLSSMGFWDNKKDDVWDEV